MFLEWSTSFRLDDETIFDTPLSVARYSYSFDSQINHFSCNFLGSFIIICLNVRRISVPIDFKFRFILAPPNTNTVDFSFSYFTYSVFNLVMILEDKISLGWTLNGKICGMQYHVKAQTFISRSKNHLHNWRIINTQMLERIFEKKNFKFPQIRKNLHTRQNLNIQIRNRKVLTNTDIHSDF